MGVALCITAFPVLAHILAELKLLTTDIGQMAMSAATVNDVAALVLLSLAIALSGTNSSSVVSFAFVIGVLAPKEGPFVAALVEKVEDLVSGLFLPLYFVSSGLKTNVATIQGAQSWGLLVLVIATACFGKIDGTVSVSLLCKVSFSETLVLGFLMNTKGLVELIVLNTGKDRKVSNEQTFSKCMIVDKTLGCFVYIVGRTTS
ncbi:hypothetical protein V6N11_014299 [Hibiscus sabdariffa]|uniref:Cation/H+ exchanger transmembrane domain-containing protein n=2 Tax=Hibiscus sabdariffa TaxID=183260 RepID=A0ABR2FN30_9ROSI